MAEPNSTADIVSAIDEAVVRAMAQPPRPHLGASQIGKTCDRALWYGFRWCKTDNSFGGRMLRLFERGQREEERFVKWLELAGVRVYAKNPETGKQYEFSDPSCGGHFGGSLDGICVDVPGVPYVWHVVEFKTHSDKSFQKLLKAGVAEAKPEHNAQMQVYMHWKRLANALYMAVNKNDDELYIERVVYDAKFAERLVERAKRIIFSQDPPDGISTDPSWWECKFCDFHEICHGRVEESGERGPARLPAVNCRTCIHAVPGERPDADGKARWHCFNWVDGSGQPTDIPVEGQRAGCEEHRYIPALIPWAAVVDADIETNAVRYEIVGQLAGNGDKDPSSEGRVSFINGCGPGIEARNGIPTYASHELRAIHPAHIGAYDVETLRAQMDAKAVDAGASGVGAVAASLADYDDDVPF